MANFLDRLFGKRKVEPKPEKQKRAERPCPDPTDGGQITIVSAPEELIRAGQRLMQKMKAEQAEDERDDG